MRDFGDMHMVHNGHTGFGVQQGTGERPIERGRALGRKGVAERARSECVGMISNVEPEVLSRVQ